MVTKQVKDWMTSEVITVSGRCPLPEAYWRMIEHKIRRLPAMDDGTLAGIVTLENLCRVNPISIAGLDSPHQRNVRQASSAPVDDRKSENYFSHRIPH